MNVMITNTVNRLSISMYNLYEDNDFNPNKFHEIFAFRRSTNRPVITKDPDHNSSFSLKFRAPDNAWPS